MDMLECVVCRRQFGHALTQAELLRAQEMFGQVGSGLMVITVNRLIDGSWCSVFIVGDQVYCRSDFEDALRLSAFMIHIERNGPRHRARGTV